MLFAPRPAYAEVDRTGLRVRVGMLGRAEIPAASIIRVRETIWPWWGGAGVRIGRGMVAFACASGPAVIVETDGPVSVRAPLPWSTTRIVLVVDRPADLAAALVAHCGASGPEG